MQILSIENKLNFWEGLDHLVPFAYATKHNHITSCIQCITFQINISPVAVLAFKVIKDQSFSCHLKVLCNFLLVINT